MKSNSPPPGPALDLGCGAGRDAVYMALRGFDVTAVDVLPDAVARAGDLAARCRVSVQPCILDLRRLPLPFPAGHYALVTVFRYLHRPLLPLLPPMLRPGGLLLVETFHERCRDTAAGPHSPERLLRSGELTAAFAPMNILIAEDGVERRGRFFSRIVAAAR
jgi:SAM-dependent methyltransferase